MAKRASNSKFRSQTQTFTNGDLVTTHPDLNDPVTHDKRAADIQSLPLLAEPRPVPLYPETPSNNVEESDDDMDWEEVDIMNENNGQTTIPTLAVDVILEDRTKIPKKRTADPLQRIIRLESHKMHTIALLASFSYRNRWINDPLLHARLLSLTPLPLQLAFSMIHPKTQPDASRRARLFESACFKLTDWWHTTFRIEPNKGIINQTFQEVEMQRLINEQRKKRDAKGKGRAISEDKIDDSLPNSDRLRSEKSLMKHALLRKGSADTSSLLFTALCRALDIPARLVVSLQAVPWSSKSERIKSEDSEPVTNHALAEPDPSHTPQPGSPPEEHSSDTAKPRGGSKIHKRRLTLSYPFDVEPPLEGWPPVVWTEVFSRAEGRWIPIDPIRYLVDKKKMFEPPPNCRINRMMYVVAYEEDGYARDVTMRYAREYGAKTAKARASSRRGQSDWWARVIGILTRPYRLHRDDIEDAEFQSLQYIEGMPTSIGGFKDHPIYALERHLRRDEVIYPLQEIGKFRGMSVYPRSNVQRLRTAETWLHEGRIIQIGQQPLKRVAQRAHTLNRKRIVELAKADAPTEVPTQGVYAEWQTELYIPEPVVDGKVPKNDFGNINLFVPTMLPRGAAHLPFQGIAKITRQLQIDYAPAVTGFEFRKGHANPIITGVVVAVEHEDLVLSAYWESARAADQAEKAKRYERVIQRWTRLIQGLRLRKRLMEDYGTTEAVASLAKGEVPSAPGGFLTEYEGVIEHFSLPKTRIVQVHEDSLTPGDDEASPAADYDPHRSWSDPLPEENHDTVTSVTVVEERLPKTLRQYAAERSDHVQNTSKPVQQPTKMKTNRKTKRPLSSDSSTSEGETVPRPKRLRRTPLKREPRSGVRKSTRTR